jgi:hypothetical protein
VCSEQPALHEEIGVSVVDAEELAGIPAFLCECWACGIAIDPAGSAVELVGGKSQFTGMTCGSILMHGRCADIISTRLCEYVADWAAQAGVSPFWGSLGIRR